MNAGDEKVFGALDKKTGLCMGWCMEVTPGFSEWCKENISSGLEIHDMTIEGMLAHMDATRGQGEKDDILS